MQQVNGTSLRDRCDDIFDRMRVGAYHLGSYHRDTFDVTTAATADRIYASLHWVPRRCRFDRIACYIVGAGAGGTVARLGVYSTLIDTVTVFPGALVTDCGVVAVDGVGLKTVNIDLQLERGLYWLAFLSDGAPTIMASYRYTNLYGGSDINWDLIMNFYKALAYGALPDPFPATPSRASRPFRMGLRLVGREGV